MAITGALVSVATTPTAVAALTADNARKSYCAQNVGTADVFLGDIAVTTSAYGHKLSPGAAITMDLEPGETVYGVVASGTNSVAVLSVGNR